MNKVKQRFYVDIDYDVAAVPKKELRAVVLDVVAAALPHVAQDYQTKITGLTVTYEPRDVRARRQAIANSKQPKK
jgi:hypothetical protein